MTQTTERATRQETEDIKAALRFIPAPELSMILEGLHGEERSYFSGIIGRLVGTLKSMPTSYQTDGQGQAAVAHLHYFKGGSDWWITELDAGSEDDEEPGHQRQAFGLADLGYGAELGYIDIEELVANHVELDLHWTPRPLSEIKHS